MKLNSLKSLPTTAKLKPLTKEKVKRGKYLSEIEMILYSTNLCYYSTKIIYDEIKVKNKDEVLNSITKEMYRIHKILCDKEDWYNLENALTKKEHKENFKRFGITKKSLKY
jgi:hypothetical protein